MRQQLEMRERSVGDEDDMRGAAGEGHRRRAGGEAAGVDDPCRARWITMHDVRQRRRGVDERRMRLLCGRWSGDDEPVGDIRRAPLEEVVRRHRRRADGESERHQPGFDAHAEFGAQPSSVWIGLDDDSPHSFDRPGRGEPDGETSRAGRTGDRSDHGDGHSALPTSTTRSASCAEASDASRPTSRSTRTETHS